MKNEDQRIAEVAELFGFSAGPAPFSLDGIDGLDEMGVPDDDDDDFDEDACPKCEWSNASWEAGICFCDHCGYIGT